jgi:ankyrin repeat protein
MLMASGVIAGSPPRSSDAYEISGVSIPHARPARRAVLRDETLSRPMTMSNRSTTLVVLLDAIVADEANAVRLVRGTPGIAKARVSAERLVEEIPHQLYVGDTALHLAAAALRPLAVAALIDAGADANAENRRGAVALHYACDARPRAGKTWNPSKQRAVVELLLDAGSDIEHTDKAGAAPLHRAVRARSPEAVRCLLERGARVDATHGRQRTTPLHIVTHSTGASGTKGAHAEQQEIVALLLQYGADPRARDASGNVPRI